MPHALALAVEIVTSALAVAGMGYFLAAILAARIFLLNAADPSFPLRPASAFSNRSKASTPA